MRAFDPRRQFVRLRDGRLLCYAEWGDLKGTPVFFFHGLGASRLQRPPRESVLRRLGVRLVTADRPGQGCSTPRAGRRLLDWPNDVEDLADRLGIGQFAVAGVSGGGPYALATAYRLPSRVRRAALISSLCPVEEAALVDGHSRVIRGLLKAVRRYRWLARPVLHFARGRALRGKGGPGELERFLPLSSNPIADRPEITAMFRQDLREAFRQGIRGFETEARVLSEPWGFDVARLRPPVQLWHGEKDRVVPPAMGHWLVRRIPNCSRRFIAGAGHFDLVFDHLEEILEQLVSPNR